MKYKNLNNNNFCSMKRIKIIQNLSINYLLLYNNKLYIFYTLLIFNSFILVLLSNENLGQANLNSEISIKIKATGSQKIFYVKNCGKPDEIYLNNEGNINSITKDNYEVINIEGDEESNIRVTWSNFNGNLDYFFQYLSDITEIDLSRLNTPIINMGNTFWGCTSLKFVNLSNLNTSLNKNMGHLFYDCRSLTSIDLSNFDTSNVIYMDYMFYNCFSLTSLNLLNFDTKNVENIKYMFKNCTLITSLDLSNFDLPKIIDISNMFEDCKNLQYLNLNNIKILSEPKGSVVKNIITNTQKNLVLCIDEEVYNETINNLENDKKNCITLYCSENWIQKKKKIFASNGSCVDDCIYLYEDKCYDKCPNGTYYNNHAKICKNSSYPFDDTNADISIIKDIDINKVEDYFLQKSDIKFETLEEKEIFKQNILNSIKHGSLMNLISSKVYNDSYLMINDENEIYLISTLENQMFMENITSINFTECEKKLREEDSKVNEELYIFRIDHKKEGYNIPIIEYAIFDKNGTILDLDKCDNIYSQYFIPISINENNLFKHDPSSKYYNDECEQYKTENGTDMTIYDRKNDYNENHLSLCEVNCIYKGYNSSTSKVECECKTKSYLYSVDDLVRDNLLNKLENEQKITNLNLMKCSNLLSSPENIKNNTGFFLLGIIIALFIIVMIIFCVRGYNNLENKIDD